MVTKVFAVYDSKVEAYMNPMFFQSIGAALRVWVDAVNDQTTNIAKHPEDYTLFELGEYDDQTGQFKNLSTPKSHGVALEYVRARETSVMDQLK